MYLRFRYTLFALILVAVALSGCQKAYYSVWETLGKEKRYARLRTSMAKSHSSMTPVLGQLRDDVLYLKHNLNAQAVGALKQEVKTVEVEVEKL